MQSVYILIAVIYFYLSYFVDKDNLYSLIIILLMSTLSLLVVYGMLVFSKGYRSTNGIEFCFLCTVAALELIEVIVRTSIDYEASKDSGGVPFLLGVDKVFRIFMTYRRLVVATSIISAEFYKSLHQEGSNQVAHGNAIIF